MPITADHETHTPTPDTPPLLSGRWVVDPEASHARFVAGTLVGLVKTPGRFRALSGDLVVDQAHAYSPSSSRMARRTCRAVKRSAPVT